MADNLGKTGYDKSCILARSLVVGSGELGDGGKFTPNDSIAYENIFMPPIHDVSEDGYPSVPSGKFAMFVDSTEGSHGAIYFYNYTKGAWKKVALGAV